MNHGSRVLNIFRFRNVPYISRGERSPHSLGERKHLQTHAATSLFCKSCNTTFVGQGASFHWSPNKSRFSPGWPMQTSTKSSRSDSVASTVSGSVCAGKGSSVRRTQDLPAQGCLLKELVFSDPNPAATKALSTKITCVTVVAVVFTVRRLTSGGKTLSTMCVASAR